MNLNHITVLFKISHNKNVEKSSGIVRKGDAYFHKHTIVGYTYNKK